MNYEIKTTIRNCTFAFKCTMNWNELSETDEDSIRFCQNCQKEVFFCNTDEELAEAIKKNKCVSLIAPYSLEPLTGMPSFEED